jgi:hypothetical protein
MNGIHKFLIRADYLIDWMSVNMLHRLKKDLLEASKNDAPDVKVEEMKQTNVFLVLSTDCKKKSLYRKVARKFFEAVLNVKYLRTILIDETAFKRKLNRVSYGNAFCNAVQNLLV